MDWWRILSFFPLDSFFFFLKKKKGKESGCDVILIYHHLAKVKQGALTFPRIIATLP